jgi:hypothetical protein
MFEEPPMENTKKQTVTRFEVNPEAMKALHPKAWAWLQELDP